MQKKQIIITILIFFLFGIFSIIALLYSPYQNPETGKRITVVGEMGCALKRNTQFNPEECFYTITGEDRIPYYLQNLEKEKFQELQKYKKVEVTGTLSEPFDTSLNINGDIRVESIKGL